MLIPQVTVSNLQRVFHVDPQEVWLKDNMNGQPSFPRGESGSFNGLIPWQSFTVEGPPSGGTSAAMASPASSRAITLSGLSASSGNTSTSSTPQFRSVIGKKTSQTSSTRAKLRVVKAAIEWGENKPIFHKLQQIFVEVDESTATVEHVKQQIQKRWGDSYTLVTADGLELDSDSAAEGELACMP